MKIISFLNFASLIIQLLTSSLSRDLPQISLGIILDEDSQVRNIIGKEEVLYNYDENSSNRQLLTKTRLQITGNFTNIEQSLPKNMTGLIKRAFRVSSYFFSQLIAVNPSEDTIIFPPNDQISCDEVNYSPLEIQYGIKNSHIHIYFTNFQPKLYSEQIKICTFYNNSRASLAIIRIDMEQFQGIQNQYFLSSLIQKFICHSMIHILGMNKDFIEKYISHQGTTLPTEETVGKVSYAFSYQILKTPEILILARTFIQCPSFEGVIILQQISKCFYFSPLFVGESLGVKQAFDGIIQISSFDIAFLKDTGFYQEISTSFLNQSGDVSIAKAKGCEFVENQCSDISYSEDFCELHSPKKCNPSNMGIGQCEINTQGTPCRTYQLISVDNLCQNSESNYYLESNYFGEDSMCFESNLFVQKSTLSQNDLARCLKSSCNLSNEKIEIIFYDETLTCQTNSQVVFSVKYSGYIKCPKDIGRFCIQLSKICQNSCSQNGVCVSGSCVCLPGYSGSDCSQAACDNSQLTGCLQCSENQCLKCSIGLFLSYFKKQCLELCEIGNYADELTQECTPCQSGCQQCFQANQCDQCKEGLLLATDGNCIDKCPDGYFKEIIKNQYVCSVCHHSCLKCFGPGYDSCTTCRKFYSLKEQSKCEHLKCDPNYLALNNKICLQCPLKCSTCNNKSECLRCQDTFFLRNGLCYNSACPSGQVLLITTLECISCADGCLECVGTYDNCTSCSDTHYFWNNECRLSCPLGLHKIPPKIGSLNQNTCSFCSEECEGCISGENNKCSSCQASKYLDLISSTCQEYSLFGCLNAISETECVLCDSFLYLENRVCKISCSQGFYQFGFGSLDYYKESKSYICFPCLEGCQECTNQNTCTSCSPSFTLQNGICNHSILCDSGYFFDEETQACSLCGDNNCLECRNSSICLLCKGNLLIVSGKCSLISDSCPIKSYYNYELRECQLCQSSCLVCDSFFSCLQCYDPSDSLFNNQCVHLCPSNYFVLLQKDVQTCSKCHQSCATCFDGTRSGCISCSADLQYYSTSQLCLPNCSSSEYYDLIQLKCIFCMENCQQCELPDSCLHCSSGYFWNTIQQKCRECDEQCLACLSDKQCFTCETDSVLINDKCQKKCTVLDLYCNKCDEITNNCLECISGDLVNFDGFCPVTCSVKECKRCLSSSQCAECNLNFYLTLSRQCFPTICNLDNCIQCDFSQKIPLCLLCEANYEIVEGLCYSTLCPQHDNTCLICRDDNSCKTCRKRFYYSNEYNKCLACPDRCLSCNEYQCYEYNSCLSGFYQLDKQCLECYNKCLQCDGPSKSDCLQFQQDNEDCHYTCTECLGSDYDQCISCPKSRVLAFYNQVKYGECKCPQGTYDILQVDCLVGYIDKLQKDITIGFCLIGAIGVLAQSILSHNPAMFYLLSEFAQTLGQIQYINIKKAYDFDEIVYVLQHFNYNILSGVGYFVKPKVKSSRNLLEDDSHLLNSNRQLEVRLQDLEKIISFYSSNNFIKNAKMLIIINFVCFSLMLLANHLRTYKKLREYKKIISLLRTFRFSLPAFALVLTSSEMCLTIQLQMKEFDLDQDQAAALFLSIALFTYQFVWVVFIIIQLGIKSAIRDKQYQLIFRIFNKKTLLSRIFFALMFIKKQMLSIVLINVFKNPINVLVIQLTTESIFTVYILIVKPFRGKLYSIFAMLNQITYIVVNTFMVFISNNEEQESLVKPILYILILSFVLINLVLYSLTSLFMVAKILKKKFCETREVELIMESESILTNRNNNSHQEDENQQKITDNKQSPQIKQAGKQSSLKKKNKYIMPVSEEAQPTQELAEIKPKKKQKSKQAQRSNTEEARLKSESPKAETGGQVEHFSRENDQ